MVKIGARGWAQPVDDAGVESGPKPHAGLFDDRREQVFKGYRCGRQPGGVAKTSVRAAQCRFDPNRVVEPCRRGDAGDAADCAKAPIEPRHRQRIAVKPPRKQRVVARGGGPAPGGETPRGQRTVAALARRRFERIRNELVDGRGAHAKALKKAVGPQPPIRGVVHYRRPFPSMSAGPVPFRGGPLHCRVKWRCRGTSEDLFWAPKRLPGSADYLQKSATCHTSRTHFTPIAADDLMGIWRGVFCEFLVVVV